jgi:hypothetical protein
MGMGVRRVGNTAVVEVSRRAGSLGEDFTNHHRLDLIWGHDKKSNSISRSVLSILVRAAPI